MDSAEVGAAEAAAGAPRRSRRGATLSVIIPMHNEEAALGALFGRLDEVLPKDVAVEIVCVDDGSRDGTASALAARAAHDPRLRVLMLARNFGQEAALTAGLEAAGFGVDYAEIRRTGLSRPRSAGEPGQLALIAARLGRTRPTWPSRPTPAPSGSSTARWSRR